MTAQLSKDPKFVRNMLFLLFALPGVAFASWVSRTPTVRDTLGASTAEMGVIIFGMAAGSILGLLSTGHIIARTGAQLVILGSSLLFLIGFIIIGVGTVFSLTGMVFVGLAIFGCGYGSAEVALNVEGSAVENRLSKTLLPAFHGSFSAGTLIGAAIGSGAAAAHVPVLIPLWLFLLPPHLFICIDSCPPIQVKKLWSILLKPDPSYRSSLLFGRNDGFCSLVLSYWVWPLRRDQRMIGCL
ncbi:MFS family permease [Paenibacillus sp. RC254]